MGTKEEGDGVMAVVMIPAYQPDDRLVELTDQLWVNGCRIIVVDDGSGAQYRHIFEKLNDTCIVLHHGENRGKGAAIKTGLDYIRKEIWDAGVIGVMDADGQHLTKDMIKLLEYAESHTKMLVLGTRTVGREMPPKSRLGNRITRAVFRFVSGVRVSDTQTGMRAFGAGLLPKLLAVKGKRYEYEMNVLIEAVKAHIPIAEIKIHTIYTDRRNTGSHFRRFRDSFRIYKELLKFNVSLTPKEHVHGRVKRC